MDTKWNKEVVESLEQNAFYKNGDRNQPLSRQSDKFILDYIKNNSDEMDNIIDYACGTGRLKDLFDKNNILARYFGYDSSSEMIEKAKEKFPPYMENWTDFSSLLLYNLPDEKAHKFDILVNIDMLQHSYSIEEIKEKIDKMCKLSNTVILHFWYKDNDDFQEIHLHGEKFPELFPSPITITNEIIPSIPGMVEVRFFDDKPYKTCVLVVHKQYSVKAEVIENKYLQESEPEYIEQLDKIQKDEHYIK